MRLADFILTSAEPILMEWESFARSIAPTGTMDPLALRDHAQDILLATAADMKSAQTASQRSDKARGRREASEESLRLNGASEVHAVERVYSGFDLNQVVSEYRSLRASVIRLWSEGTPHPNDRELDDLTRFNEAIDQSLAKAVSSYTKRVDQSRDLFLAILGHDLRNPLNSMMMSAEMLSRPGERGAETASLVSGISSSAAAMAKMISDLLDFTSAGLGASMPLSVAAMDLNNLCREVVGEMRSAYPKRTIQFTPKGDLNGRWDSARLRQVLSNLLGNDVQHGRDKGPVDLTATGDDAEVCLTVHNQGPPIPPDALPTIFDPLVRGSSPELQNQRRPGSIGLGLYIAREVVIAHGGSIDVQSTAEAGTTFTVRLPRDRAHRSVV